MKQGARLIATNPDRTCPVEGGEIPDCAGMIAAVEAVTDRKVEAIVGKPSPIILEVALQALGCPASDSVIVGDRIETDMVMGRRMGLATILVLSGVTRPDDPRIAALAPDHVLRSVRELYRVSRLNGIDTETFDAVVIGGGMAGAGVARDLALRGASVALLEKGDFASGTSSKSSKLIHGGLRYLELFDFRLVRESLREKKTLERLAPHLVRPLPFLVPVYRGSKRGLITVRIGMWLYDLLTPGRERERFRVVRAVDALTLEPSIQARDLRGAGYYFDDLLLFPERLCLENALSASRHGARVHNYCEVEEFTRGPDGIDGVRVRDLLTGRVHAVRASVVVNCAGPWVDRLRELADVRRRGPAGAEDDQGHPLHAAAHDGPGRLPLDRRRPHDLRDPVAGVLHGRHDGHRFRRRPGPPVGHARRRSSTCWTPSAPRCPTRAWPSTRSSTRGRG